MKQEMTSVSPIPVAILVFPEASASVVYGLNDLFHSAGRDWGMVLEGRPGPALFHSRVVARRAGPLQMANGVTVHAEAAFEDVPVPAVVCIPEVALPPGEPLAERFAVEVTWLQRCFSAGATLAAACSGALLLAEAGLLEGQEATTHWAYCSTLSSRYPRVRVHPQRALVLTGEGQRLVMAGGGTTWLDLALYLIARTAGLDHALKVARLYLIDWHDSGQQPFARLAPTRQSDDALITESQAWIADHAFEPAPVAAMVRRSGLAERTFSRRFRQATGMTPLEYVHTLRLEESRHRLETTDEPVEAIALAVGYEDAAFFGRLFRRKVNLTPAQYRRRFGGLRRALSG